MATRFFLTRTEAMYKILEKKWLILWKSLAALKEDGAVFSNILREHIKTEGEYGVNVKWNDRYLMGLEDLDKDHKQLFQISSRIIDTIQKSDGTNEWERMFAVREGVKYLKNYFLEHAAREEAYMRRIGYRDYAVYKYLHDEFQFGYMARFDSVIGRGSCTREEAFEFVGGGIGWLLEHVATADMAIVGKGVLCWPAARKLDHGVIAEEINRMFVATLNMEVHATVLNEQYIGEPFGDGIYQSFLYRKGEREMSVVAGIEKKFLIRIAQSVYDDGLEDADALILSSIEIFGANFWRTLGERLIKSDDKVEYLRGRFLSLKQLRETMVSNPPAISVLFGSDMGKFFIASEDSYFPDHMKNPSADR